MAQSDEHSGVSSVDNGRLSGWKEISAHLGKSVRTAQRWEKELSLPVRRIHTEGGEIVFAFCHEIDDWLKSFGPEGPVHSTGKELNGDAQPDGHEEGIARLVTPAAPIAAPAGQPRRRTLVWLAAGAGLLLVVTLVLLRGLGPARLFAGPPPQPATWKVEGGLLKVFNSAGRQLWHYDFGRPLLDASYVADNLFPRDHSVFIADVDADGTTEVGIITRAEPGPHPSFYLLNHDGSLRSTVLLDRTVQFGSSRHAAPWNPARLLLTDEPDGSKSIWLVQMHHLMFPAVLQKIASDGKVLAEYWSNGHILSLHVGMFLGWRSIFVGATNNEHIAASLAVLDYANPSGSAPAVNLEYRCVDCPPGQPLAFFVFPATELAQKIKDRPAVTAIRSDGSGNLTLNVDQAWDHSVPPPVPATTIYTLNQDGKVIKAETGDTYRRVHFRLETSRHLDHPFRLACEKQLFPVLRWDHAAQRFVPESGKLANPPR